MSGQKIIINGSHDFHEMKASVYIHDPNDPAGTMQRHEIVPGKPIDVPAGWVMTTVAPAPDMKVTLGGAREKDYGI